MNKSPQRRLLGFNFTRAGRLACGLCLGALASCVAPSLLVESNTLIEVSLEEVADGLARFDVVFLGEQHDSQQGHTFQFEVTELLASKRDGAIVALEMFESDVQADLDRYLAGELDRESFLANARPWGMFAEFYEPVVEAARLRGDAVIAANIPRKLARKVVREGVDSIRDEPFAPRQIDAGLEGAYRDKIVSLMNGGEHKVEPDEEQVNRAVASQCVKDDAMAESIAAATDAAPGRLVVVLLGAFHCEERLGTVERLASRRPELKLAVVGMVGHNRRADDADRREEDKPARGRYVLYVGDSGGR